MQLEQEDIGIIFFVAF